MSHFIQMASTFKLWQVSLLICCVLFFLGFTGSIPFTDVELRDGKGKLAIQLGAAFFVFTCGLKYLPPPTERKTMENENESQDG